MHLARFESLTELSDDPATRPAWERLARLREEVSVVLEGARREKTIGSSLEGAIALTADPALETDRAATGTLGAGLADLFIVSEVLDGQAASAKPSRRRRGPGRPPQVYPGLSIQFRKPGDGAATGAGASPPKPKPRDSATGAAKSFPSSRRHERKSSHEDFPRIRESALYRTAYFLVSLAVLLLDQWTKGLITRSFEVHQSTSVISNLFDLTYVRNSGAAFGLFASVDSSVKAIVLNSVAVLVFLIVSAYALRSSHRSIRLQLGFALILGGAIGNLMDRVRFGFVVDFLDFSISGHHWPAFNVADSAICIGVGLLFLDMLRNEEEERREVPVSERTRP